jgi:hypothetical protein
VTTGRSAGAVTVELGGGDPVTVRVELAGIDVTTVDAQIEHAADRFVAAGGAVMVRSGGPGVLIEGTAPCGS